MSEIGRADDRTLREKLLAQYGGRLQAAALRAGREPARALSPAGLPWWIHECGSVLASLERPGFHSCDHCHNAPGFWKALFT